ncbi:lectin like domain-containing protein [Desulfobotulus sp. H1]|uniref:Lectin like domain-containing protein n=1 Tax=Desulfobotulus pelophilus TaxID=2823377 RepID=A0ABT3N5Q1_9BACT|nr:lectin like domain-containing protein [Desulfobotulus pelophilus]MCW7752784.1 lectin like domain-containing protein [Desulfobotulus pelophilus]
MIPKFLYAFLITAALIFPVHGEECNSFSPLNPTFESWTESLQEQKKPNQEKLQAGDGMQVPNKQPISGRRPSPLNLRHLHDQSILPVPESNGQDAYNGSALPATYDLRQHGKVPPVKDQDPWGTCWAFASMGASESNAMVQGWPQPQFSRKHLAWFAYTDMDSHRVGFDAQNPNEIYNEGGDAIRAAAILSRWTGYVADDAVPYEDFDIPPPADIPNTALLKTKLIAPAGQHFVTNTKHLIREYGAVNIYMYVDEDNWDNSFNTQTSAFYYPHDTDEISNHAVLAVGWDDNFPKENFSTQPPENGAWIVQNSWGEGWGDQGYFYMSYYDKVTGTLEGEDAFAYVVTPTASYGILHFHDPLGVTGAMSAGADKGNQWFSNVFTAEQDQFILAAGLYTLNPHTSLRISVYLNPDPANPSLGTTAMLPLTLTKTTPGYHVIDFDHGIFLRKNQTFSIVVQAVADGNQLGKPIAVESAIANYSSKARAERGQSFISTNGTNWTDTSTLSNLPAGFIASQESSNINVSLKALGTALPIPSDSSGCFILNAGNFMAR